MKRHSKPASDKIGGLADPFRMLVDSVRDYSIFMLDPEGLIRSWNSGAERLKGYSADEIIGQHFSVFYPPATKAKCAGELEEAARNGRFEDEGWRVRKDGTRFWANVVISAIRNDKDELAGFAKITRDLTDKQATIEQLRMAEERQRLLVESVKDYAIFMLDPDGIVRSWNPGAERLKGYTADEIIGQHFSVFYPPEIKAKCPGELEEAARDGRFEDEGWRVRKDGTRFWANVIISAIRNEKGTLIGFAKVTRDLTDRREAERTAVELARAGEAVRLRDEFLSVASHELRTPMTPIAMYLQSMERTIQRGGTIDSAILGKARRQIKRLSRLVDDLLDFTRLHEGRMELECEEMDLVPLVATVVDDFKSASSLHEIVLSARGPIMVRGDPGRLEQVLVNLLQNAIKYSPSGGRVEVVVDGGGEDATVTVRDQGIGIPTEEQGQLFTRFFRARNANNRNFAGLGLGLFLSNEIVRRHGGRFEVSSDVEKGAAFTFHIPKSGVAAVPCPSDGRRVLLVDDDPDVLDSIGGALREDGYTVRMARNGAEALDRIAEEHPDLLLVDLTMPVLDGPGLIDRVRTDGLLQNAPIVVFSADRQIYARATALKADAALRKPVDFEELHGTLERVLRVPTPLATPPL